MFPIKHAERIHKSVFHSSQAFGINKKNLVCIVKSFNKHFEIVRGRKHSLSKHCVYL